MKVLQVAKRITWMAVSSMICVGDASWRQLLSKAAPLTTDTADQRWDFVVDEGRRSPPQIQSWCQTLERLREMLSGLDPLAKRFKDGRYMVFIPSVIWQDRVYPNYHEWSSQHWTQGTELDCTELQLPGKGFYNIQSQFWLIGDCCPTKWPRPRPSALQIV